MRPDHGFGFGLKDPMPCGPIDESVFSYDGRCHRIMGLQWKVNGRSIWWSRRYIAAGDGLWQDVDRDRMWTMDRRLISGDGPRETDYNRSLASMKVSRLCGIIQFSRSGLWFRTKNFLWNGDMHVYNELPAVWFHRVRYRALFRNGESNSYMPELQWRVQSRIRSRLSLGDPKLQVQHRYRTSRSRFGSGGAMIFKDGDDSAGIATTPTTNNYRTGSAGKKHCDTHSPIEKAGSGKCTQRSDG